MASKSRPNTELHLLPSNLAKQVPQDDCYTKKREGHFKEGRGTPPPRKLKRTDFVRSDKKKIHGTTRNLALVEATKSNAKLSETLVVRRESPWDTFRPVYHCDLAGESSVAVCHTYPHRLVTIRQTLKTEQVLEILQQYQNKNLLSAYECFLHAGRLFYLHEECAVSLDNLVACDAQLSDHEMSCILSQLLDGLIYLTGNELDIPDLNTSDILVTDNGVIKIGRLELIQQNKTPNYNQCLLSITSDLIGGESTQSIANDDRTERIPLSIKFSQAIRVTPLSQLRQHELFADGEYQAGYLGGLVSFAKRTSFVSCQYI